MDIIERIKKLYNLSTRNSNTAEAAAAAAKIQQLCFAHELELEKIIAQGTDTAEPYQRYDFVLPNTTRADLPWKKSLFAGICLANFCEAVYFPKTFKLAVIGQKHNFETIEYTYEYLTGEILRLAKAAMKAQAFIDNREKRAYLAGFCEGAVAEVRRALRENRAEQAKQNEASTALVVVKDANLKQALTTHFPRLVRPKRQYTGSNTGFQDGKRAGAGIALYKGIGTAGNRARLN